MPTSFSTKGDHRWPSGLPHSLAILSRSPSDLEAVLNSSFHRETDDLGRFSNLYVALASGRVIGLRSYDHDPVGGTAVLIDSTDDPAAALRELVHALQLLKGDFTWIADASTG